MQTRDEGLGASGVGDEGGDDEEGDHDVAHLCENGGGRVRDTEGGGELGEEGARRQRRDHAVEDAVEHIHIVVFFAEKGVFHKKSPKKISPKIFLTILTTIF